jgi:hypothetical protein
MVGGSRTVLRSPGLWINWKRPLLAESCSSIRSIFGDLNVRFWEKQTFAITNQGPEIGHLDSGT